MINYDWMNDASELADRHGVVVVVSNGVSSRIVFPRSGTGDMKACALLSMSLNIENTSSELVVNGSGMEAEAALQLHRDSVDYLRDNPHPGDEARMLWFTPKP